MNFSDNLKKIRKDNNLSQEQIAEALGVSRQSVSKWESGLAYPEMDKMISLCKRFNLNIDDLLNQDIKEVNNNKQAKNNINKFIDDFLDYITKTIDMFSSMNLKQKLKCIFEQLIIITFITIILLILGSILSTISYNLFSFIPSNIYYPFHRILEALYLIFCLILSITLVLHIFKVRYLDYFKIIKDSQDIKDSQINESTTNETEENKLTNQPQPIILSKKQEQVIIRDPKHSSYKFISSLLKCLLFLIKTVSLIPVLFLCISLILLVVSLIISFLFIKTGLLFIGILLILISSITLNIIILTIIYNFIISRKNKKNTISLIFITSIILLGIGIGISTTSILEFNIITDINSKNYSIEEYILPMNNNLKIKNYYGEIEYIESNNNDIKIEIIKPEPFTIELYEYDVNSYYFNQYIKEDKIIDILKLIIKDINNKELVDYSNHKISIYTTKENIKILKENLYK